MPFVSEVFVFRRAARENLSPPTYGSRPLRSLKKKEPIYRCHFNIFKANDHGTKRGNCGRSGRVGSPGNAKDGRQSCPNTEHGKGRKSGPPIAFPRTSRHRGARSCCWYFVVPRCQLELVVTFSFCGFGGRNFTNRRKIVKGIDPAHPQLPYARDAIDFDASRREKR